jgi:MoxR-like ATPase
MGLGLSLNISFIDSLLTNIDTNSLCTQLLVCHPTMKKTNSASVASLGQGVVGLTRVPGQYRSMYLPVVSCARNTRLCGEERKGFVDSSQLQSRSTALRLRKNVNVVGAVRSDQQYAGEDTRTVEIISQVMSSVEEECKSIAAGISERLVLGSQQQQGSGMTETNDEGSLLRVKVEKSVERLQRGLLERDMEVRLLLLAALCGEHLLLLGPPGTAKSELSRRLSTLTGGQYFERLLTRFSVPEELFGPLSIKGLEKDEYNRKTDGYLPTAEVAFIDEIFKANSAILNALLTLLNERLFDNGAERLPVPLLCLVGASNELPESEELDALYDRFLIRKSVDQVSKGQLGDLARLAAKSGVSSGVSAGDRFKDVEDLSLDDFKRTSVLAVENVDISDEIIDVLTELRNYLQDKCEPPIYVSDRRFMKAVNMMQVAAYADNRDQVSEADCLLLEFVMGNKPDDCQKVRSKVLEILASDLGMQQCELLFLGLFGRACNALESDDGAEIQSILSDCTNLNDILVSRLENVREALELDFPHLRSSIWLSDANASSAVQFLEPQMDENKSKLEDMVKETLVLQKALASKVPGGVLEKMLPKRFKQYQKGIAERA